MLSFKQFYLLEASGEEIYQYYKNDFTIPEFNNVLSNDPTSIVNKENKDEDIKKIKKVGQYSKWILDRVKNKSIKKEDTYKAFEDLKLFNKIKNKLDISQRDINKYKTLNDLYDVIKPFEGEKSKGEVTSEIKTKEAEKIFDNEKWTVIVPKTEKASCLYGANTRWCTAAEKNNMFEEYNQFGKLYIIIDKVNNTKYQFHFESASYMDVNDREITSTAKFKILSEIPILKKMRNIVYFTVINSIESMADVDSVQYDMKEPGEINIVFNDGKESLNKIFYFPSPIREILNDSDTSFYEEVLETIDNNIDLSIGNILDNLDRKNSTRLLNYVKLDSESELVEAIEDGSNKKLNSIGTELEDIFRDTWEYSLLKGVDNSIIDYLNNNESIGGINKDFLTNRKKTWVFNGLDIDYHLLSVAPDNYQTIKNSEGGLFSDLIVEFGGEIDQTGSDKDSISITDQINSSEFDYTTFNSNIKKYLDELIK